MGILEEREGTRDRRLDENFEAMTTIEASLNRHTAEDRAHFEEGSARFKELDRKLEENTRLTKTIESSVATMTTAVTTLTTKVDNLATDTAVMVAASKNFTGFREVTTWLGNMLVKTSAVIIASAIVWLFVFRGEIPTVMKKAEPLPAQGTPGATR